MEKPIFSSSLFPAPSWAASAQSCLSQEPQTQLHHYNFPENKGD